MNNEKCPVCGGNDFDLPCAYPGDRLDKCLREKRLRRMTIPEKQRELVRKEFERDAALYGFDLARFDCPAVEPWSEYKNENTGHRWAGWLAANGLA